MNINVFSVFFLLLTVSLVNCEKLGDLIRNFATHTTTLVKKLDQLLESLPNKTGPSLVKFQSVQGSDTLVLKNLTNILQQYTNHTIEFQNHFNSLIAGSLFRVDFSPDSLLFPYLTEFNHTAFLTTDSLKNISSGLFLLHSLFENSTSSSFQNVNDFVYGDSSHSQKPPRYYSTSAHTFTFSLFGGLLGAVESLLSKLLTFFFSSLVAVLEPLVRELIRILYSLIPVFEKALNLAFYVLQLVSNFALKLFTLVNKQYYLLESLSFMVFTYWVSKDYVTALVFFGVFVFATGFVRTNV